MNLPGLKHVRNGNRIGLYPPPLSRLENRSSGPSPARLSHPPYRPCTRRNAIRRCPGLFYQLPVLCCAILLILLSPNTASSLTENEQPPPQQEKIRKLTLDEIVQMGIEASPKLWAQRYVIEQAEAELGEAKAGRLPRMEYLQIAGVVPEARGTPVFSPDERTDLLNNLGPFTRLELTVNQPLYTFGRLKAYIKAAEKGKEAKQASLKRFELELVKTLKDLYYTWLFNEDLYRLVSDTEEQFQKAVDKAKELLEDDAGTLTQKDLLKLRYGLSRASGQLLEIQKGRRLVLAALRRLLELPQGEEFILAEKRLKPVKFDLKGLELYQEKAQNQRPEWKELAAGIEARGAELTAEQRKYYPDFFATGLLRYAVTPNRDQQENPFAVEDFNYFNGGVYLGVRLALDFGLPDRIAGKKAELFALMQEQKEAVSGMRLEVEKAYREVKEKEQGLSFARQSRKNGRALAALSAASFHLGLGDTKEIFEAFGIYTEAAAKYYLAVKDYNVSVAELARVTGVAFLE